MNRSTADNPYTPPGEEVDPKPDEQVEVIRVFPAFYWPAVLTVVGVLLFAALPTNGLTLPLALGVIAAGMRTYVVISKCSSKGYRPTSLVFVSLVSLVLSYVFQLVAFITFCIVCVAGFSLHRPGISSQTLDQMWLGISVIIGFVIYYALIWLSSWIAIKRQEIVDGKPQS